MQENIITRMTPQKKIIGVNNKFGNTGIKKQQGTTRAIYDSLPIDGRTEYRFFEEANTRAFPFTNMSSDGNKLGVGSAMVVERAFFSVIVTDGLDPFGITQIYSIEEYAAVLGPTAHAIQVGEFSIEIANSQVLKQLSVLSFDSLFNKSAEFNGNVNFEFDTQIVISPLLEFVMKLRAYNHASVENTFLRLTVEGTGAIISPRTTM